MSRKYPPNIIFVHKVHFPLDVVVLVALLSRLRRIPLVYDVDDPQWVNSWMQDFIISNAADKIFCSSRPFLEHYKKINPKVVYIPTVLDDIRYASFKTSYVQKDKYVIGWVGDGVGHFKLHNFHIIKPALEKLAAKGVKFVFRIVGTKNHKPLEEFIRSSTYEVDLIPQVPFEEVPGQIQRFDVGIAPIQDVEWFRINATAKGVEYMACGVPVVASPVGAYNDLIKEEENGFLARTTEEWTAKLLRLLSDAELRRRVGEGGMKTVQDRYSYSSIIPLVKKEFMSLCAR